MKQKALWGLVWGRYTLTSGMGRSRTCLSNRSSYSLWPSDKGEVDSCFFRYRGFPGPRIGPMGLKSYDIIQRMQNFQRGGLEVWKWYPESGMGHVYSTTVSDNSHALMPLFHHMTRNPMNRKFDQFVVLGGIFVVTLQMIPDILKWFLVDSWPFGMIRRLCPNFFCCQIFFSVKKLGHEFLN